MEKYLIMRSAEAAAVWILLRISINEIDDELSC